MRDEKAKQIIDVWKTVVGVQQHFNEIEMKIRGLFVTLLLALFASIGFLLDKKWALEIWQLRIQYATLLPLFGAVGACLFYFIDRHWYHRLLVGSVVHGASIEKKYKGALPELSLTESISAQSPYEPRRLVWLIAFCLVKEQKFRETGRLHSDGKIELFYKSVIVILVMLTFLLATLGGLEFNPSSKFIPVVDVGLNVG